MTATPWHLGPLTPFDLESTGVDTREARIVTGYVATVLSRAEKRRQTIGAQVLINPGVPIPQGATDKHGITDEIAQAKGCAPTDGVNSLAEAVARSLIARIPVVGFNLAYDLTLLYRECLRWDLPTVAERVGLPPTAAVGPIIDAYVLDKHFDQWRKGSRTLDDRKGPGTGIAAHYGVPLTAAHTADGDAIASVRVAVIIAERYAGPDMPTDATALHVLQKLWKADQATSLQRYFRTKGGKPDAYVDPCWPICTDDTHPSG